MRLFGQVDASHSSHVVDVVIARHLVIHERCGELSGRLLLLVLEQGLAGGEDGGEGGGGDRGARKVGLAVHGHRLAHFVHIDLGVKRDVLQYGYGAALLALVLIQTHGRLRTRSQLQANCLDTHNDGPARYSLSCIIRCYLYSSVFVSKQLITTRITSELTHVTLK